MPVSRALRRLLHIRNLEEEQQRQAFESAMADLHRLEEAREAVAERDRQGRHWLAVSAQTGDATDRQAGLVERSSARNIGAIVASSIAASEGDVDRRRQEFLEKRVERRQAETLIEETAALDELESDRRTQQAVDDWFGARSYREGPSEHGEPESKKTQGRIPGNRGQGKV